MSVSEAVAGAPVTADLHRFARQVFDRLERPVPRPLRPDLHLVDDLGFDSLELFEFQVAVEELCGHPLPDELWAHVEHLGQAFEWYQVKADQRAVDRSAPAAAESAGESQAGQVPLATDRVGLRPLAPPDYEWLYELTTRADHLVRWRDRGQTFRIEEWIDRLWAGVAAQFVAVLPDGTALGLVTLYHHDARNRHARLAVIFDETRASSRTRIEAVGLLLDYAFEVFDLLKVYAEVVEFNLPAFASAVGPLFDEEGRLLDYEYAHGRHWAVHVLAVTRPRFIAFRQRWRSS